MISTSPRIVRIICTDSSRLQSGSLLHRNYSDAYPSSINTGNNISFPVTVKYRMHFIPVIIWILHSDDWTDLPVCSKKTLVFFLLFLKLLFIRNTLKLAATTFLRYITFHNFQLTCYRSYTIQTATLLFHQIASSIINCRHFPRNLL